MIRVLAFLFGIPVAAFFAILIAFAVGTGLDNMFVAEGSSDEGWVGIFTGSAFLVAEVIGIVYGFMALDEELW